MCRKQPWHVEGLEDRVMLNAAVAFAFPLGSSLEDTAAAVVADAGGNVYVAGNFAGRVDFDPGRATYVLDSTAGPGGGYVAEYSATGTIVWARQYAGSVNALARDPRTGDLALATTSGGGTPVLTRLDPTGAVRWSATLVVDGFASARAMTFDGSGNLIAAGSFFDGIDLDPGRGRAALQSMKQGGGWPVGDTPSNDAFIVALSSRGKYVWGGALARGRGEESATALAVDAAGNVYATGSFEGRADLDPSEASVTRVSGGAADAFCSKFSSAGKLLWAVNLGGAGDDAGRALAVTPSGDGIYVAGSFRSTADLDPSRTAFRVKSVGRSDAFLVKLSPDARLAWGRTVGGRKDDRPVAVTLDPTSGDPIVAGAFRMTADFAPGRAVAALTSAGGADAFIWRLASSGGRFVSAAHVGGVGDDVPAGIAAARAPAPVICLAGTFSASMDADPGGTGLLLRSGGGSDAFVLGLSSV